MRDFMTFFRNRIARPDEGWTVERLNHDATPADHVEEWAQSLGHALEWMGFYFEMETHCGVTLPFPEEDLRTLARNTLDNGLSPCGAFRNDYVPRFRAGPQIATFWPQVEAPLGSLWAAARWGEETFPREEAERMLAFYRAHLFVPEEYGGGIFSSVSENGVPLRWNRGYRFKCDHHAVRLCEKVLEYGLV
jgi:mannose/cellobiose epimerase-like protein (N-acyl-D-glucosamine 2-epimerase family)